MTLTEYDKKIEEFKTIRSKATGLRLAELTSIIDDLATARVELITKPFIDMAGVHQSEIDELNSIAATFETATEEISSVNNLIDNAINIGKKMVSIVA